MLSSGKRVLTLALVMAANALIGRGDAALKMLPRPSPGRERKAKKHKAPLLTSRFTKYWRVPLGGGAREVARRRRQIEEGTLRINAIKRPGSSSYVDIHRVRYGVDRGSPDGDVLVIAEGRPDGTMTILKHTAAGKSEAGVVIVE
jgi:hypothetical protein